MNKVFTIVGSTDVIDVNSKALFVYDHPTINDYLKKDGWYVLDVRDVSPKSSTSGFAAIIILSDGKDDDWEGDDWRDDENDDDTPPPPPTVPPFPGAEQELSSAAPVELPDDLNILRAV